LYGRTHIDTIERLTTKQGAVILKLSSPTGETLVIQTEKEKAAIHFKIEGGRAKLKIKASRSVKIWRGEIAEGNKRVQAIQRPESSHTTAVAFHHYSG